MFRLLLFLNHFFPFLTSKKSHCRSAGEIAGLKGDLLMENPFAFGKREHLFSLFYKWHTLSHFQVLRTLLLFYHML